jgi:hypothetical protein
VVVEAGGSRVAWGGHASSLAPEGQGPHGGQAISANTVGFGRWLLDTLAEVLHDIVVFGKLHAHTHGLSLKPPGAGAGC